MIKRERARKRKLILFSLIVMRFVMRFQKIKRYNNRNVFIYRIYIFFIPTFIFLYFSVALFEKFDITYLKSNIYINFLSIIYYLAKY